MLYSNLRLFSTISVKFAVSLRKIIFLKNRQDDGTTDAIATVNLLQKISWSSEDSENQIRYFECICKCENTYLEQHTNIVLNCNDTKNKQRFLQKGTILLKFSNMARFVFTAICKNVATLLVAHWITRLVSKTTFSLPPVLTNYGEFNSRYTIAKVWNSVHEQLQICKGQLLRRV